MEKRQHELSQVSWLHRDTLKLDIMIPQENEINQPGFFFVVFKIARVSKFRIFFSRAHFKVPSSFSGMHSESSRITQWHLICKLTLLMVPRHSWPHANMHCQVLLEGTFRLRLGFYYSNDSLKLNLFIPGYPWVCPWQQASQLGLQNHFWPFRLLGGCRLPF